MSQFCDFIVDSLQDLGNINIQRMFGGYGLRLEGVFFGIISDGRLYFKTSQESRKSYEKAGMEPFQPSEKQTLVSYYEVPVFVIEDHELLCE